jgi:hypothetical protein
MDKDYLQLALMSFNTDTPDWYGWKKENDNGNKIPNSERMQYQYIKIIKDGATMPSEAEVNAKIQELKDAEQAVIDKKASGKQKLLDLGLTEEEVKALMGA